MTLQHAEVGIVIAGRHFLLQIVVALVPWFRVDQHEDEDEAEEKKWAHGPRRLPSVHVSFLGLQLRLEILYQLFFQFFRGMTVLVNSFVVLAKYGDVFFLVSCLEEEKNW